MSAQNLNSFIGTHKGIGASRCHRQVHTTAPLHVESDCALFRIEYHVVVADRFAMDLSVRQV